ncbi:hypothetical protein M5K25_012059 [Dendrobium thyrsiflorum]|uniref:Uncharacterized protein n=1 Tax=Dendrobium thyrsiflorum TaxID=117978 RepID=A0ABD0UW58_DENTH
MAIMIVASTYQKQNSGDCGLNQLLKKNALDDCRYCHQILLVLLLSGMQPEPIQGWQDLVNPRIEPVNDDRGKGTHHLIADITLPEHQRTKHRK